MNDFYLFTASVKDGAAAFACCLMFVACILGVGIPINFIIMGYPDTPEEERPYRKVLRYVAELMKGER